MSARCGTGQRGFTLLEVIVAVALFAMLMGLVYAGMSTAVRAYEAAEQRVDAGARLRVVGAFLRRSLTGAFPMAVISGRDWQMLFHGDAKRLTYVADLPGHLGIGGLHEIELFTRKEGERSELVMRRRPLAVDDKGEASGEFLERVLLEESGELQLRYFGSDSEREPASWRDEWPAGRRMPLLLELRLSDADGVPWPPLVVSPQVDTVRYQGAGTAAARASVPSTVPGSEPDSESPRTPARTPVPRR